MVMLKCPNSSPLSKNGQQGAVERGGRGDIGRREIHPAGVLTVR
jgi:hypothetical protein